MNVSPQILRERLPVWDALSEFFLDTELQDADYNRISGVLASSPYSEAELWEILLYEVYPVCECNLLSVAGEWAGFSPAWLLKNIAPRLSNQDRQSPILHDWMFREPWDIVQPRISEIRSNKLSKGPSPS